MHDTATGAAHATTPQYACTTPSRRSTRQQNHCRVDASVRAAKLRYVYRRCAARAHACMVAWMDVAVADDRPAPAGSVVPRSSGSCACASESFLRCLAPSPCCYTTASSECSVQGAGTVQCRTGLALQTGRAFFSDVRSSSFLRVLSLRRRAPRWGDKEIKALPSVPACTALSQGCKVEAGGSGTTSDLMVVSAMRKPLPFFFVSAQLSPGKPFPYLCDHHGEIL
jgi:hypothetical protein